MGSRLVAGAFAFVAAHNERARNDETARELESLEVALLALMGHTAIDSDPAPAFFVTRTEICRQLGIRDTEAGRKRIQRALAALAAAGAVALPEKYQRGYTPRYRLIYQGGCPTSTLDTEVWTPGIPPTSAKGDAVRPKYGRLASPSMDAQHPPEEGRGRREEGDARASDDAGDLDTAFELAPPPISEPEPTPPPAPSSPYCDRHPTGTSQPCYACMTARKQHTRAERSSRTPTAPRIVTRRGRRIHDNPLDHTRMPDGTCRDCEIHPADLAAQLEPERVAI